MARGVLQRSCRIWPWPRGNGPGSVHPSGLSSRSAAKQGRSSWRYAAALAHLREFEGARRGSHCGASIFLLKKPDFSNIYAYLGLAAVLGGILEKNQVLRRPCCSSNSIGTARGPINTLYATCLSMIRYGSAIRHTQQECNIFADECTRGTKSRDL